MNLVNIKIKNHKENLAEKSKFLVILKVKKRLLEL